MESLKKMTEKKYLMNNDYVLVLSKIKEIIGMEKFNNTKILIDRDNNLPDVITLKNVEILMTYYKFTNFIHKYS